MGAEVYIRLPSAKDERQFLHQVRQSAKLHRASVTPPRTPRQFRDFLKLARARNASWFLVCPAEGDLFAGVVILNPILGPPLLSAELGYYALEPLAGQGYMGEGVRQVLDLALVEGSLQRVQAHIEPDNARSKALAARCGLQFEGVCRGFLSVRGRWRDHEQWAITRADWRRLRRRARR